MLSTASGFRAPDLFTNEPVGTTVGAAKGRKDLKKQARRIDFDIKGGSGDYFDKWDGSWVSPTLEGGWDDDGFHSPGDNEWRNSDPSEQMLTHLYLVDAAKLYAVLFHTGEGDADSSAVIWGSTFTNSESIQNTDNVDWYRSDSPDCGAPSCLPDPRLMANKY